jgi:DNA-binding LytR/AlgR family response regulator
MNTYTCIAVDDSEIQLVLLKNYIKKTDYLELKETFNNPVEAYQYLCKNSVDILLLDIDMPNLSGLDLLKMLQNPPRTILITSKSEFALEAFELDVVDYIVKPPEYPRFLKAINKAVQQIDKQKVVATETENELFIKTNGKLVRLEINDILYIEAMSDYVIVHTEDKRSYIVYSTLKQFEDKMSSYGNFYRIHRSYLINLQKIKIIENGQVLIGDKLLPIGNTYKEDFLKKVNKVS